MKAWRSYKLICVIFARFCSGLRPSPLVVYQCFSGAELIASQSHFIGQKLHCGSPHTFVIVSVDLNRSLTEPAAGSVSKQASARRILHCAQSKMPVDRAKVVSFRPTENAYRGFLILAAASVKLPEVMNGILERESAWTLAHYRTSESVCFQCCRLLRVSLTTVPAGGKILDKFIRWTPSHAAAAKLAELVEDCPKLNRSYWCNVVLEIWTNSPSENVRDLSVDSRLSLSWTLGQAVRFGAV